MKTACRKKGIEYRGCFDCQGFLAEVMHEPVQKKLGIDDEKWAVMVKQMTRPSQPGRCGQCQSVRQKIFCLSNQNHRSSPLEMIP